MAPANHGFLALWFGFNNHSRLRRTIRYIAMPKLKKSSPLTSVPAPEVSEKLMRVRLRALEIPPIKDGLVIGVDAAIGGEAMARTLRLMTNEKFDRILVKDEIVQEIIVRSAVLRKVGQERLLSFVLKRVKPVMAETELLLLDIDVELVIEDMV